MAAWQRLAERYCLTRSNVLGADLFNEPYAAGWGVGDAGTRWDLAAARMGDAVLDRCPHWLIVVEGVAQVRGPMGPSLTPLYHVAPSHWLIVVEGVAQVRGPMGPSLTPYATWLLRIG